MATSSLTDGMCTDLAELLVYPPDGAAEAIETAAARLQGVCAEASQALEEFRDAATELGEAALEELYVRTFDFAPLCAPYVGVHLFGGNGEGFKRSQLLAGLAEACRRMGLDTDGELPDHAAVVLRLLDRLPAEEREDLARLCLLPALERMAEELARNDNPYRHAVHAIHRFLMSEFSGSNHDA